MAVIFEDMKNIMMDQILLTLNDAFKQGNQAQADQLIKQYKQLQGVDWEKHILRSRYQPSTDYAPYVILCSSDEYAQFRFRDSYVTTIFAVHENDSDTKGWVDATGLSFYDRLRYAGYKQTFTWRDLTRNEWEDAKEQFRVLHPRELLYYPKSRQMEVVVKNQRPDSENYTPYLVLCDGHGYAQFDFSGADSDNKHKDRNTAQQPTIFAAHEHDPDTRGWVDVVGLSFYERLRYVGYKESFTWKYLTQDEWETAKKYFRVLHPRELLYSTKTERARIVIKPDKSQRFR